jgi:S-adenosylmethionine hydrolase
MPTITITTDFGDADGFTGVLKGVITGIAPDSRVVDIAHAIPAGDAVHAAFVLRNSYLYFPPGTIHIVIVDPGVGGSRRALAVRGAGQYFVAPDNGVLAWVVSELAGAGEELEAWSLDDERFRLAPVSNTFHGRDIFAPAAAYLAMGIDPDELGPRLVAALEPEGDLSGGDVQGLLPRPGDEEGAGRVIHIDTFGNCITTIEIAGLPADMVEDPESVTIEIESRNGIISLIGLLNSYESVAAGQPVALEGSSGLLEIAINGDSAARTLAIERGDSVRCLRIRRR